MTNLEQAELTFLAKKGIAKTTLTEMRRRFWTSEGIAGRYANDLEKGWVRAKIVGLGGTPSGNYLSSLWMQLNGLASLPVSKELNENRKNYFLTQ
jgi:hypothetical protein